MVSHFLERSELLKRKRSLFLLTMIAPFLLLTIALFLCTQNFWLARLRGLPRDQPLLQAVYNKDIVSVQRHLADGADVHATFRDPYWEGVPRSVLMLACERGNVEIVRLLLDHGAQEEINCVDGWMNTPLSVAIERENKEVVELLIQRGANTPMLKNTGSKKQ